jgi:hypothetical protein
LQQIAVGPAFARFVTQIHTSQTRLRDIGGFYHGGSASGAPCGLAIIVHPMPTRIVTYAHRAKRSPRKQAKAAAINGPAIVIASSKRDRIIRRRKAADDDTEASPEIKAFFARKMRPP